jgi:hypothetical protein
MVVGDDLDPSTFSNYAPFLNRTWTLESFELAVSFLYDGI